MATMQSHKHLNSKSLIGMALQRWDSMSSWDAIFELRFRPEEETVHRCRQLFASKNWRKRALAVNVICQLQYSDHREYARDASLELIQAGLDDPQSEVIAAAAFAAGHRECPIFLNRLIELASDPDCELRYAATFGLGRNQDAKAIPTMLALAKDVDDDVRNWAMFGLGSMWDLDTPEIREALWIGYSDSVDEIRGEALAGLAKRRDKRVLDLLRSALEADLFGSWNVELVEMLSEPEYQTELQELAERLPTANEAYRESLKLLLEEIDDLKRTT
ncbi:HEAT repeat domain-containing protein [Enterobacterales bacterium AE_CKDN230030158-1A_HGKHYDSX7]